MILIMTLILAKPPLTYRKQPRLKKWLKRNVPAAASRGRAFTGEEAQKKGGMAKLIIFLLFLAAAVAAVRTTGVSRYMDQRTLRSLIAGYGVLAPIVYMLIYAVAPALFLPGLPLTIAGGILFGAVWGVVYAIIGATAGACVAFLISRYLAREWVEGQLKSPRWKRLDAAVEKHGWKVVAFTRLIPLFPFNLLNYAFGLTKIGFRQYAAATFVCMLPACIAFIVFSRLPPRPDTREGLPDVRRRPRPHRPRLHAPVLLQTLQGEARKGGHRMSAGQVAASHLALPRKGGA